MIRSTFLLATLFASLRILAQGLVPFTTTYDRFVVFDNGTFNELEPRKPQQIFPNNDRIAYISAEGEFKLYSTGGKTVTLQRGETVDVRSSHHQVAWMVGPVLRIANEDGPLTICRGTGNWSVTDSLIAYHNTIDRTLNVWWRGRSFPVADVLMSSDAPQWKAGCNTLVFFDHTARRVYLFYRGETTELCNGVDYSRVAPGGDVVAYMDDYDDTFRVFDHGERIDLEPFPPQTFQAGLGIVGYVNNGGALRCYQDHKVVSLADFAPTNYWVQDSVMLFVESGMLKTLTNGKVDVIERYVPETWSVSGAMITYLDLNRQPRIYHRGERLTLSKEAGIKQVDLYTDAITWRSNSGMVKVWWRGKEYEHY